MIVSWRKENWCKTGDISGGFPKCCDVAFRQDHQRYLGMYPLSESGITE